MTAYDRFLGVVAERDALKARVDALDVELTVMARDVNESERVSIETLAHDMGMTQSGLLKRFRDAGLVTYAARRRADGEAGAKRRR